MTPEQRQHVEDLFHRLAGLPPGAADAVLYHLCGDDAEVRREVKRLLDADASGDPVGEVRDLRSALRQAGQQAGDPAIGRHIGPYKIMSPLGEGGFGIVYLAERRDPFVQRVALKIVKPGMDTRAVIARFEQERQALAVMDHPNVARVLDGGVTAPDLGGRPYFVMELVHGEPITTYSDKNRLTIRERLELFLPVCEAIQHAHHKGIIHRDIKPSNILIEVADGRAIPKVIDFGVAKAVSHTLTEKTVFTEQGQLIGTPEYMSPEQADSGPAGIDTRSDLYSLGVVLYELLSGALPFDRESLRACAWARIVQIIRDVDPPRPSTRLSSLGPDATAVAERRQVTGRDTLQRILRDELDWITLKAMEKDRSRRYSTAVEFARDIRNYLEGHVVLARPPTTAYRTRKFLRRHRALVSTVTLFVSCLLAGLGVSLSLLDRALDAERSARDSADRANASSVRANAGEAAALRNAYDANIAAAATYLAIDDGAAAAARLTACPPALRGWDWRRLSRSADGSIARLDPNEPVSCASFTADGRTIAVLGVSHLIRFDADTRARLSRVRIGEGLAPADGAAFVGIADSGRRALFRQNELPHWWVEGTGRVPIELPAGCRYVPDVPAACSPLAKSAVLVGAFDAAYRLVLIDELSVRTIDLEAPPARIAISDDGETVAAASIVPGGSCQVKAWAFRTGAPIAVPGSASVGDRLVDLTVSSDASLVAASGSTGVATWRRLPEGATEQEFIPLADALLAASEDSTWIAAASGRIVHLFNLATGSSSRWRSHRERIASIVFSPDGKSLVTASPDGQVRLWSVAADVFQSPVPLIAGMSAAPTARRLLIHGGRAPAPVCILDLATGGFRHILHSDADVHSAALDRTGTRAVVATDEALVILDAASGEVIHRWTAQAIGATATARGRGLRVAFDPGGTRVLVGLPPQGKSATLRLVDVATGGTQDLGTIAQPATVALAPASCGVPVAGSGFRLLSWPAGLGSEPSHIGGISVATAIDVSPDQGTLAVATSSGSVYLAPLRGPQSTEDVGGHSVPARAIAWMDGGTRLASGAIDGAVAIWALDPLRVLCVEQLGDPVVGLAFDEATSTLWVAQSTGRLLALRAREAGSRQ